MTPISFCKFHGFGNDYIVIERANIDASVSIADLAPEICHRHTGAGSDGIAMVEKLDAETADYGCRIINPDGSEAAFSGNGTRCAVAYLYYKKMWTQPALRLRTLSGIKNYTLIENLSEGHYWFESEIGKPRFASDEIPVLAETRQE